METYPDSESLEKYIQSLFDGIKKYSPNLAKTYMEEFFIKTGDSNPLSNKTGIRALHKTLGANLNALNKLEQSEGNMPVEMVFNDINGKKIDLSNMRGKVVLIDFWSIRCGPCIQEMPHVRAMYDKYQNQGFEVIGISADGDKEQVEQILKKTNANWPQRLDNGKDVKVRFHSLYNITSLPTVWLLDKNGVIVDRQARGERLEPLIRKYLGLE
jgi:thiol-disulfide isomerase/thioredoxin